MKVGFRRLVLGAAASVVLLSGAGPLAAQDIAPLQDRVDRIERALNDLRRFVHRGGGSQPAAPSSAAPSVSEGAEPVGMDAKITALESEIRALTNRVEEINFTVRRLDDRMNRLVEDIDFRLLAIERNMAAGGAPAPQDGVAPAAGDGAAQPAGSSSSSAGATQPRSLGTVRQETVQQIPANAGAEDTTGGIQRQPAGTSIARAATVTPPASALEGTPEQRYDAAFNLLQSKRFTEAETAFQSFLQDHPKHELAGNAQYWLGEAYYVQKDYERAASAFLEGYKSYRTSSKSPDNLLKLGMTLAILNQKSDACAVFAELQDRYPNAQNSLDRKSVV